ncbi:DUF5610 domain-containing protein [Thiobaca trueperi]|uniref:DUF5610 domain-containing protein n=1 Tax=Thiobaca trueperi TaxID=127458 RepID=A0A4R3N4Q9_9GAMM|nr:DUF5610 domain-containing protein [Thiobaca trueperi]TCT23985.1 hypothetical protein EDC35_101302 [Thiobaca trueperi]
MINIHSNYSSHSNVHANAQQTMRSGGLGAGTGLQPGSNPTAQALSSLQEKALNALSNVPGMDISTLKKVDANEYTPEKIADRISSFVAMGLENARAKGKSEEEVQALYDSAMKGAEQGFKEAKDILSNLKVLNGDIATQVQATEDATFAALEKLSPSKPVEAVSTTSGTTSLAAAERYQRADDFSLTLKTREGDVVKVNFSRSLDAQSSFATVQDGEGNQATRVDLSRTEKTGYEFSVEGDLNEEEITAIQNLMRDVGQVANDFYGGDVQKAFDQVSNVSFDSKQLASMDLRMSRSEQYSSVQQYQKTQQLENPEQANAGRRLGHLANDLRESFQKPALEFLEQAREVASQLMQGLMEQDSRFKDASSEQQSIYQSNLDRLLGSIKEPS